MRPDGRRPEALRPLAITRGFLETAAGSALISMGRTRVLCTASIEPGVPAWREADGAGWLTAEYDMLPASTPQRKARSRTRLDGRTHEIQRLVGRALRVALDLSKLGPHTIYLDCDVLQADGGTRTAAITGAFVALCDALAEGERRGLWAGPALICAVAAVSAGIVAGEARLDLDYAEDMEAEVDANLVMTSRGEWVEVQATGERATLGDDRLSELLELGRRGVSELLNAQRVALMAAPACPLAWPG